MEPDGMTDSTRSIFCVGPLLHAAQIYNVFNDCKTFVDMPLLVNPETAMENFLKLGEDGVLNKETITSFIEKHFGLPGSDLIPYIPVDFVECPPFLEGIKDERFREWASKLNSFWLSLSRQVSPHVAKYPERHTLLPRNNAIVVPGGRFRECYYWDTYWILKGLIICGMLSTSIGIVENFFDDVFSFGMVPNGCRKYYLKRSQPPLLSDMVVDIISAMQDISDRLKFLHKYVRLLEKEYNFWMIHRCVKVKGHALNRYWCDVDDAHPRPESYREDLKCSNGRNTTFAEITAIAESGWDFSTRWYRSDSAHEETNIRMMVPVDLNIILYRYERNLSSFFDLLNCTEQASFYSERAKLRSLAINEFMWDETGKMWRDLILLDGNPEQTEYATFTRSAHVNAACFIPLWGGESFRKEGVVEGLKNSGLIGKGGILTTLIESGEQWDRPSCWPPLQWFVVEGLREYGSADSVELSGFLAISFLESAYKAWIDTGFMHEKYNGDIFGGIGRGGEYEPQVGFGWSNGVALDWINRYYCLDHLKYRGRNIATST